MKLRVARARLIGTSALGLGITLVLAAATSISRRYIEASAFRSPPPILRTAAVFAPTLLRESEGAHGIDAVTGPAAGVPPAPAAGAGAGATTPAAAAPPAHLPQVVPEELLLALAPTTADTDAARPAPTTRLTPTIPAVKPSHRAPAPPAEPPIELIDDNLWRP